MHVALKQKPMIMGKISIFSQNDAQSSRYNIGATFPERILGHMQKIPVDLS